MSFSFSSFRFYDLAAGFFLGGKNDTGASHMFMFEAGDDRYGFSALGSVLVLDDGRLAS